LKHLGQTWYGLPFLAVLVTCKTWLRANVHNKAGDRPCYQTKRTAADTLVVHVCRNADLKVANGASMVEGAQIALHLQCIRHVATLTKQRPARQDREQGGQSTGDTTEHIERELQKATRRNPSGFLCLPAPWPSLRKGHYPGEIPTGHLLQ
jgi:hypothetical protein